MVQPVNGVTLVCAWEPCSKTFVVFPSQVRQGRNYCSVACSNAGNAQIAKARIRRVSLICAYVPCSQPFDVIPSSKRQYCSHTCSELANRYLRVERTTLICAYVPCSQPFDVIPARLKEAKYCCRLCQTRAMAAIRYPETLTERFWSKVQVCEHGLTCQDCCWPWQASLHHNGYGQFQVRENGKLLHDGAHLASFFLHHGRWPADGLQALHSCDNRACVSFWHLWEGTQIDNMQDCVTKGRNNHVTCPETLARGERNGRYTHPERTARGERNGNAKLTDVQWEEALALWKSGEWTQTALGKRYGVSQTAISRRLKHLL